MNTEPTFESIRRGMLLRSIGVLIAPLMLMLAALACAGTPLSAVPVYTCPTAIPQPTATVLPGTAIPIPLPPPTPYQITPPQDFYVGDAIFIGVVGAPTRVRLRLQAVNSSVGQDQHGQAVGLHVWQLEVRNLGSQDYTVFPAVQMYLHALQSTNGLQNGVWSASQEAAEQAQVPFDGELYTLAPNMTRVFTLAAFSPNGQAAGFTFVLDPTVTSGSATLTWRNQNNPFCIGDVAD